MIEGKNAVGKAYRTEDFAGMQVTVVGLGASGIAACRVLGEIGARVRATDSQSPGELDAVASRLRPLSSSGS